jgi:hypothetical protein
MPLSLDGSRVLREPIRLGIGSASERDLVSLPTRVLPEGWRFAHAEAGTLGTFFGLLPPTMFRRTGLAHRRAEGRWSRQA